MQVTVLYKEFYSFTDKDSGEVVRGGKLQLHDPNSRVNANGKCGCPAFFLPSDFSVSAQIPDDKVPAKYELQTVRIPKKDKSGGQMMEERVTGAKFIG